MQCVQKALNIEYDARYHRIYLVYFVLLSFLRRVSFLFPASEAIQKNTYYNANYHSQKRAYKYRGNRPPSLLAIKRRTNLMKLCFIKREDRIRRHGENPYVVAFRSSGVFYLW
jgi:hypothetical protein